jgi:hypothetical protein
MRYELSDKVALTMQTLLSPAADMLPHWLWAAMCHFGLMQRGNQPISRKTEPERPYGPPAARRNTHTHSLRGQRDPRFG